MRQQSSKLKKDRTKGWNSNVPRFQYSYCSFSHKTKSVSPTLRQSIQHFHDTLLTKLQRHFIELHNASFFQRLEHFI